MNGSLRDQLKALGIVKQQADMSSPQDLRDRKAVRAVKLKRSSAAPDEEISLAQAYAARVAAEQADSAALKRQQEEKLREKRARKATAQQLLAGKSLNKADADLPRYFDYGKKIRRIYVDAQQLKELNGGQLGIAQLDGKFLLVAADVIKSLQQQAPEYVALCVDPHVAKDDDFPVPGNLHW